MSGLAEHFPEFVAAGAQVSPNDIDRYEQFVFANIGTSATYLGTVSSATASSPFVFDNVQTDYPRNILFSVTGVAGGMGGTAIVNGYGRAGTPITETFTIGSANGGGSVSGTHMFTRLTSATFSPQGLGGTAIGTAALGYAVGTLAGTKFWLGLPQKIASTADIKMITWIKNFVNTTLNGGTFTSGTIVNGTLNAISGTGVVGSAETFIVLYKPTFDNSGKANQAGLV